MEWKVLKGPYSKHYIKNGKKQYRYFYLARCVCGKTKEVLKNNLDRKLTSNCGCKNLSLKKFKEDPLKEYRKWKGMISRCYNKKTKAWPRYGARGIKVSKDWLLFENFYKDMGPCPKNHTLERINNNGNYEKQNCKWATIKEQNKNRSNSRSLIIDNNNFSLKEIALKKNITYYQAITLFENVLLGKKSCSSLY